MSENTSIEWCDATINAWWGCTKVSEGCAHCYAETLDRLRGGNFDEGRKHWGKGVPRWNKIEGARREALALDRKAKRLGRRYRVFGNSMNDWLDDEVPREWLADLLELIHDTPNLDWLMLTKRPENWEMLMNLAELEMIGRNSPSSDLWAEKWCNGRPPENVWVGTTCENQRRADERIPELLKIPAAVRFLSCEPLLGPVDLSQWLEYRDTLAGTNTITNQRSIGWVIAGGESGPGARPMHPDWPGLLRDQCLEAKVPFLFKQWGEYAPSPDGGLPDRLPSSAGFYFDPPEPPGKVWKFGKKAAGRVLDGREWNDFPTREVAR